MLTVAQLKNLDTACAEAVRSEKSTGIPAELSIAQWALESGWGMNSPGNNCFGIKEYPGCFGKQLLSTTELFNLTELSAFLALGGGRTAIRRNGPPASPKSRSLYDVKDFFATFPSLAACFAKRAKLFVQPPYLEYATKFKVDGDLAALVMGISKKYATAEKYGETLLSIIHSADVQSALASARNTNPIS